MQGIAQKMTRIEIPSIDTVNGWQTIRRTVRAATPEGDRDHEIDYCRNTLGMEFVRLTAGRFRMGDEISARKAQQRWPEGMVGWHQCAHPRHPVRICNDIYFGAMPVTREQFGCFVEQTGYQTHAEVKGTGWAFTKDGWQLIEGVDWRNPRLEQAGDHPVVFVTWNDARAFCDWLGRREHLVYALPAEAQWEYAARAGNDRVSWYWGDNEQGARGCANVACRDDGFKSYFKGVESCFKGTSPVARLQPNAWGLYDMIGNVLEWCEDTWLPNYHGAQATDRPRKRTGAAADHTNASQHVVRGGAWSLDPSRSRSASRGGGDADYRRSNLGFRVIVRI